MLFLILATLGQTLFGLVLRHAQKKGHNLLATGAINYLTCTFASALAAFAEGSFLPSTLTLTIALLGGIAYVTSYFLFLPAMNLRGLSVPVALVRLSILIPILFSVLLWAERPNLFQTAGIALALASLALLSLQPGQGQIRSSAFLVLAALFLFNGACLLSVKTFQEAAPAHQAPLFFLILFGTAAVISSTVWLSYPHRFSPRESLAGFVLGCSNVLGNFFLLRALTILPGVIVFPISSSLGILLTALFASLAWKERLHRPALLGIALAIAAVALINLK